MPVHYFTPPERTTDFRDDLTAFVEQIEANGEEIIDTERYGTTTAFFTRGGKPAAKRAAPKPPPEPPTGRPPTGGDQIRAGKKKAAAK